MNALSALDEAKNLMEVRWGHANAPYDADMLHVLSLLKIAQQQASEFEEKSIETNRKLISLIDTDLAALTAILAYATAVKEAEPLFAEQLEAFAEQLEEWVAKYVSTVEAIEIEVKK